MPIKIEFPNNENCGLKIAVVGVGENGVKAVSTHRHSIDSDNNKTIKSISYSYRYSFEDCDETVIESVRDSEWLFVIADTEEKTDFESALQLVNIQKQNLDSPPFSILIDISQNHSYNSELATSFNTVISIDDASKAMRAVEMLISQMYAGLCTCIDACDVQRLLELAPYMKFNELETENFEEIKKHTLQMKQSLGEQCKSTVVLTHISYPDRSDETIFFEDVIIHLAETLPDTHQIYQYKFFTDVRVTKLSWIYGEMVERRI